MPILQSEEVQEVIAYVLNALGNFACGLAPAVSDVAQAAKGSEIMWHELQQMNAADGILTILKQTQREEIRTGQGLEKPNWSGSIACSAWPT